MRAFTLLELLIVVCIIGLLAGLAVPALTGALQVANQVSCASNLRHVGIATRMYLKDHDDTFFLLVDLAASEGSGGKCWYFGFETTGSAAGGWGRRTVDRSKGTLAPYLGEDARAGVCPALPSFGDKAKYADWVWTYGVNAELTGPVGATKSKTFGAIHRLDRSRTGLFADSAQVNTFQAPASRANPLIEEWFYIQTGAPYVHFRHGGRANVLFADWHVEAVGPAEGGLNPILPGARIGYLDPARVLLRPRG